MDTKEDKIEKLNSWLNDMDNESKLLIKEEYNIEGSIKYWINDLDESSMDDIINEYGIE